MTCERCGKEPANESQIEFYRQRPRRRPIAFSARLCDRCSHAVEVRLRSLFPRKLREAPRTQL